MLSKNVPVLCTVTFALGAVLLFWQLGAAPLADYDEASYAQMTREALESRDFVSPHYLGKPFLEKPPLYLWLAEASSAVIPSPELAMRIPSALAGLATVLALMLLAFELTRNRFAAALSGAVLLSTGPFIEAARQARLDTLAVLCIVLSAYFFVRGLRDRRWYLAMGAALGLCVLAKSVLVLFAVFAIFALAAALRRWDWLRERHVWLGLLLGALIIIPWHAYQWVRFGGEFWDSYLGYGVLERFASRDFPFSARADYIGYLLQYAYPWSLLAPALLAVGIAGRKHLSTGGLRAITASTLALVLIGLVLFGSHSKIESYLLPLYPFMALLIAAALAELARHAATRTNILFFASLLCVSFSWGIYNGWHINPYFAAQDELAREEKDIGFALLARAETPFYAFGTSRVESIIFYSGNTRAWELPERHIPPVGSVIILPPGSHQALYEQHPEFSTVSVYEGSQLRALEVVSED